MKRNNKGLAAIQRKMSRADMKKIMAGDDPENAKCADSCMGKCNLSGGGEGTCGMNSSMTKCYCKSGTEDGDEGG